MTTATKSFRKGDLVIQSGIWSTGEGRPEFGPHVPSIYVRPPAVLGSMGKKQGFVWADEEQAAREQIYARQLNAGIFHAADEAEAIVFARAALRAELERAHRFEVDYGDEPDELKRHADRVADRVWETCPIEHPPWVYGG